MSSSDLLMVKEILKILERTVDELAKIMKYLKSMEEFEDEAYKIDLTKKSQ
jgi:hypothetical protein